MTANRLSTLDWVCLVADGPTRPLDFALVQHFAHAWDLEGLARGARSARNRYPVTGSRVSGDRWAPLRTDLDGPQFREADHAAMRTAIEEFLGPPMHLEREPPLRQLLIGCRDAPGACLVTRVHHCAADLLSALAWVSHQLGVASRREAVVERMAPYATPTLASAPEGACRNPYRGRCDPLWTADAPPSASRNWTGLGLPADAFAGLARAESGFTYNDLLVVAALETLNWWNGRHGAADRKVGVWLPLNIRREKFEGFGNGSGRIRVHRSYPDEASLPEKCRAVRGRVDSARQQGEWMIPRRPLLARLPLRVVAPLARRYLNRPWADMGTAAFTHVQQWPAQSAPEFAGLERVEVIGALHARHALMLAALTHCDRTWLTLTYDPALLGPEDADSLARQYERILDRAAREL